MQKRFSPPDRFLLVFDLADIARLAGIREV
jgi:hypothetical protein